MNNTAPVKDHTESVKYAAAIEPDGLPPESRRSSPQVRGQNEGPTAAAKAPETTPRVDGNESGSLLSRKEVDHGALAQVYETPPFDISRQAFLEVCLAIAQLVDGEESARIGRDLIYDRLSPETEAELQDQGGITSLHDAPSVLTSSRQKYEKTLYKLGPVLLDAQEEQKAISSDPATTAEAIDTLCTTGDFSRLIALSAKEESDAENARSSSLETGRQEAEPPNRTRPAGDRNQAKPRPPSRGRPGTASRPGGRRRPPAEPGAEEDPTTGQGRTAPARRAVEVYTLLSSGWSLLTRQPPFAASEWGIVPLEGDQLRSLTGDSERTACRPTSADPRDRRGLSALSEEKIEKLKRRTPRCSYLPIPASLYERIVEWRPVLKESEPLAAMLQQILFGMGRDEDWTYEQDCTGIPIPCGKLFATFDYGSRQSAFANAGINSGMLLDLYQREVDEKFEASDWNSMEEKARVVKAHGIPDDIVHKSKEVMLSPETYDDWKLLVNGRSANRRNHTKSLTEKRREKIGEQKPVITPPGYVREIQTYLNGLPQCRFSHGGYGIFREEQLDTAIETARQKYASEQRRDEELRKLFWLSKHPQPLYGCCSRFPRLKADHANQAMNLPTSILRSVYTERDAELDLTKAHLSCMVPLAEQEGIDASLLREYLNRSMEGEDIWTDLAEQFSDNYEWDSAAARKTVKKVYALVYGSTRGNLLHEMSEVYGAQTGNYRSFDAFRPALDHELADEILRIRGRLRKIITERRGMKDAAGRFIPLEKWESSGKDRENWWRGVLAYVNASYEQKLMAEPFSLARKEAKRNSPRFRIWLYQADGFTMRVSSEASLGHQIRRLQEAVDQAAGELDIPTALEVDHRGKK